MVAERNGCCVAHDAVAGPTHGVATAEHGEGAQRVEAAGKASEANVRVMAMALRQGVQSRISRGRACAHLTERAALVECL